MGKDVAVVVIHGMGDTDRNYDTTIESKLRGRLSHAAWRRVEWQSIYYQDVLQKNQKRMMESAKRAADIDWIKLRRFVLYGFSDAASMGARPHRKGSVYEKVQRCVLKTLDDTLKALGDPSTPVVLIAHSLGCQVISNYIWDAQQSSVEQGVFRSDLNRVIGKTSAEDKFRRLTTVSHLFTSGCNIPIFVAGLPREKIKPIAVDQRGWSIRWENYFDPDDVLGWPLRPMSPAYREAVAVDKSINVGSLLNHWTPLSHNGYWQGDQFLDPIAKALRKLLA